jgi:sphingolipid C9-methyltransferase
MTHLNEFLEFRDASLPAKWAGKKVPISDVYEAYLDGRIEIEDENWEAFFAHRHDTMTFRLTESHLRWAFSNFIPQIAIHSRKQDKEIVGDHYNRGNDFFGWFLGEPMVYTAAEY